MHTFYVNILI